MAVNALPWAEVSIDGERVGETPIGSVQVPIGTHEVVFRHPDLGERRTTATVTTGRSDARQHGYEGEMKTLKTWVVAAAALLAICPPASAQAPAPSASLAAARTLYASAEYGGALDMLNGLAVGDTGGPRAPGDRSLSRAVLRGGRQHRRGVARHRGDDRPGPAVPPVVGRRAAAPAIGLHRRPPQMLPGIVQQNYVAAKAAFDKKDYAAAAKGFTQVVAGLNDPDIQSAVSQPPLSDLKMLATGFHDLAAKAVAPPPAPAPAAPAPEPVVERVARVYSPGDGDIVPPITIRQAVPPYPGRVLLAGSVVVDVVIDLTGTVESAVIASPPNQTYDRLVLGAAKAWQYEPAKLNGQPVKYRKRIQISLVPTPVR